MARAIGVCSWSLRPDDPLELAERALEVGVTTVQLDLTRFIDGEWSVDRCLHVFRERGIAIRSGMMKCVGEDYSTLASIRETGGVRVDERWAENQARAEECAALARDLEVDLVTFHAGFIPHDPTDPVRRVMVERLRELVSTFARQNIRTGFETGQETATTLLGVLNEIGSPTLGVNFDPANMILYGMGDPVSSLEQLAPHVRQIHIKDARAARSPGEWGSEVAVGDGDVDWKAFFGVVAAQSLGVDLMIEREAGDDRVGDMRRALAVIDEFGAGREPRG
ncbi:MAG: sugar phosphate isomerase/epimerase [Planctomycetes bacterium]|nr:sugar phosphate isomerase/epimerase [Planctomycetota bacterium]